MDLWNEFITFKSQFTSYGLASLVEVLKLITFIVLVFVIHWNTNRVIKEIKRK